MHIIVFGVACVESVQLTRHHGEKTQGFHTLSDNRLHLPLQSCVHSDGTLALDLHLDRVQLCVCRQTKALIAVVEHNLFLAQVKVRHRRQLAPARSLADQPLEQSAEQETSDLEIDQRQRLLVL